MGGPILEARFGGLGAGWKTPTLIPRILREYGYEPDLYVCDRTQRLEVVTLDILPSVHPTIVGDMNSLPFADRTFRCGFFDPPYNGPYKRAVNELLRVCSEKAAVLHERDIAPGYIGVNGLRVPPQEWGWRREASVLLLCGNDARVRCLNLFRHEPSTDLPTVDAGEQLRIAA